MNCNIYKPYSIYLSEIITGIPYSFPFDSSSFRTSCDMDIPVNMYMCITSVVQNNIQVLYILGDWRKAIIHRKLIRAWEQIVLFYSLDHDIPLTRIVT
jgi:hypothetical protein